VRLYHFRSQRGQAVDRVLENSRGQVVGIEVKLSATPSPRDFSGLKALQEHLGKRFLRGVLVYTGPEIVPFGERLQTAAIQFLIRFHKCKTAVIENIIPR
jgi:predicted AAA+ superfamily ATPase